MGDTEKKTGTEPASAAKRKKLSVVVSVYNEEAALPLFYRTAGSILDLADWDYELIFVNDGSVDDSRAILYRIAAEDPKRVVNLALPDAPVITGTSAEVFAHYGLTGEGIAHTVREALK